MIFRIEADFEGQELLFPKSWKAWKYFCRDG